MEEKKMPAVSIIVPVYNGEKVLSRCLDSVLQQDFAEFEVLLMDDGSCDGSAKICDAYAKKDARVRVYHKENSGVSATRNMAIELARGEYLQFLDCDDWITPDATGLLVRAARQNEADLVIADFYRVVGERLSHKGSIEEDAVMTREEFSEHMLESPADYYYGVLWNKLYRRDIVMEHGLRMDAAISWCEDFMFNLEYIRYAKRFFALQVPIYYYVKTKGSLVTQNISIRRTIEMKRMVFEVYEAFYREMLSEEAYEKKRLQIYSFLVDIANDGTVLPRIFPGSKRVGEERAKVNASAIYAEENSFFLSQYRHRKLLEHYMEPVALKHGLQVEDVEFMLCLTRLPRIKNRRELADFMGLSLSRTGIILQTLSMQGFYKIEESKAEEAGEKGEKELLISWKKTAVPLLEDMEDAYQRMEESLLKVFTKEERRLYEGLTKKLYEAEATLLSGRSDSL